MLAALGLGIAVQSALGVAAIWVLMWAPFYLTRTRYGQYLFFPVLLVPWLMCMATAVGGLVLSLCAIGQRGERSRGIGWVIAGMVVSLVVFFASLPALFLGNLPLQLLGIE